MIKVLIATRNQAKLGEYKEFLCSLPIKLVSLNDLKIEEDIEEDGKTYKENSQKKALYFAKKSLLPTVADDSGIEISAINNAPGVRTRRWLGFHMTDKEIINHMKKISKTLPKNNRKASFKAVITLALPKGKVWSVKGQANGIIAEKMNEKLWEGYPFRSFFYFPKIKKYYFESELTGDEQKIYNHRYKAIQRLIPVIKKEIIEN
jgi:XTP/dITP diphosphohydrolase